MDHILSDLSTMTRLSWVAPWAWLSFIELDKAVFLVWLDWLVFCEYGFSVFALWCPLATPTILLGFLLPWVWGISSQLLQQSAAIVPYLGWGVSPPWMNQSSLFTHCCKTYALSSTKCQEALSVCLGPQRCISLYSPTSRLSIPYCLWMEGPWHPGGYSVSLDSAPTGFSGQPPSFWKCKGPESS